MGVKMPYKSQKQAGYFHTHEKEIGKNIVKEWDEATKGKKLPKTSHSKPSKTKNNSNIKEY
jgi:hypothetical protein